MKTSHSSHLATSLAALLTMATGVSCGNQAFKPAYLETEATSPGTYYIAPKVDILFAQDDSGSQISIADEIAAQIPVMLDTLEGMGWNYHFAVTPLTSSKRFRAEVVTSKHDPNWGDLWTPPFPGATMDNVERVSAFRTFENFTGFISPGEANTSTGGQEDGFYNIEKAITVGLANTGFLRDDALLAIFVMSNGDDTSGIKLCKRQDGIDVPCEQMGLPGTQKSSFDSYKAKFKALKSKSSLVSFYSAVSTAPKRAENCLENGKSAYPGARYADMAKSLSGSGSTFDICSLPIATVMDQLATKLQGQRNQFRSCYIFLDYAPDPANLTVTRYNSTYPNGQIIPQDTENGWTYDPSVNPMTDVPAIDQPILTAYSSGYAIELHGTACLYGMDRAKVTSKAEGALESGI